MTDDEYVYSLSHAMSLTQLFFKGIEWAGSKAFLETMSE